MTYQTTCPRCASVFRLGEGQLDVAQGWVQCSICGSAFNARASLLMEDGSPVPVSAPPAQVAPPPEPEPRREASLAQASRPTCEIEYATPAPEAAEPPEPASEPAGFAAREASADLPSIILIDPDRPAPDDLGPMPEFGTASVAGAALPPVYPPARPPEPAAPAAETADDAGTVPQALAQRPDLQYPSAPQPRRTPGWVWGASSVLLLAGLIAQTGYFLRDAVVSHLPQTRPAYESLCDALGCRLSLPKNLALLQIVGSDLQTEANGRLKLSLTLGNRADHVQAWPVLVLTLTDQRNRPLARRSFAPSEYLGDPRRIDAGIPPRSEQPLILPLNVRNLTPMGFGLQLTY